jgi:hypothetical protein
MKLDDETIRKLFGYEDAESEIIDRFVLGWCPHQSFTNIKLNKKGVIPKILKKVGGRKVSYIHPILGGYAK